MDCQCSCLAPSQSGHHGCTWTDTLFAAPASHHFLQLSMVLQPVMWRLLLVLQLSTGLQPLKLLCTPKQPASCAGKILSWHRRTPAATIPCDGSLYVACMQLCLLLPTAAPPCSSTSNMQGFRRSQVPAIKDVKVGQLVSKSERCRVYRGTFQGKPAVIKVGRRTKTCLTAAPRGNTQPLSVHALWALASQVTKQACTCCRSSIHLDLAGSPHPRPR